MLTKFGKAIEQLQSSWFSILDPDRLTLPKSGYVRDPIHGHISLDPVDFVILDSPPLQRLRGIAQLSFVDRIYPGANHTRFEHTLGVATLVSRVVRSLKEKQERIDNPVAKITEEDVLSAKIAGYFHDIGHLPFSHALEPLFEKFLESDYAKVGMKPGSNKPHELVGYLLITSSYISSLLRRLNKLCNVNLDPNFIAALSMGSKGVPAERSYLREIIHSEFDCDRMDYLLRDGYYCGVPHASVDPERLTETFTIVKRDSGVHLGVEESGLPSVESMYVSRSTMYITVYLHHTSRIIEGMILRAMYDLVEADNVVLPDLLKHNDGSLVEMMKWDGNKLTHSMIERLEFRRFFKRLVVRHLTDIDALKEMKPGSLLPQKVVMAVGPILHKINEHFKDLDNVVKYEKNLARSVYPKGSRTGLMLLDCPRLMLPGEPDLDEYFPVSLANKKTKNILELSPVVRAIAQERTAYITSIILAGIEPEKYKKKATQYMEDSFKSMFDLDLGVRN